MKRTLFRANQMEQIDSPSKLNGYIHVPSVGNWVALVALFLLVASLVTWGIGARITTSVDAVGVYSGEQILCYLSQEDVQNIKKDMHVSFAGGEGVVQSMEEIPLSRTEVREELNQDFYYDSMSIQDWNYKVWIKTEDVVDGVVRLSIETGSERPIDFLLPS